MQLVVKRATGWVSLLLCIRAEFTSGICVERDTKSLEYTHKHMTSLMRGSEIIPHVGDGETNHFCVDWRRYLVRHTVPSRSGRGRALACQLQNPDQHGYFFGRLRGSLEGKTSCPKFECAQRISVVPP